MSLPPEIVALMGLPRLAVADRLPGFLAGYIHPMGSCREQVLARVDACLREASDEEWAEFVAGLPLLGATWGRHDALPLGRRIIAAFFDPIVDADSALRGVEHLLEAVEAQAVGRRVLVVGNHISYVDPSVIWMLLRRAGHTEVADRLTAVAGPKVYTEPMRLVGASSMHTIKVAQSSAVASGEAAMSPRDVVRAARTALDAAQELMGAGRVLIIYPEGRRSRSGRLGPFLRATGRWLTAPGTLIVPFGLVGADQLYTLQDDRLRPTVVSGRFGPALDVDGLIAAGATRDALLVATHTAIDALLPESSRAPPEEARVV